MIFLQLVSVTFDELSLKRCCNYDSVSLYDGSSDKSPSLDTFSYTRPTPTIISSGSSLFVVLSTDSSINTGRFALRWKFVDEG